MKLMDVLESKNFYDSSTYTNYPKQTYMTTWGTFAYCTDLPYVKHMSYIGRKFRKFFIPELYSYGLIIMSPLKKEKNDK